MEIATFKDFYMAELQELANAEKQLMDAQQRMAEMASHPSLKNALSQHRQDTEVQKQRLDSILQKHGADPTAHTDQSMECLLRETEKMLGMLRGDDLRDAGLIASAQKIEHYEIAAFGTAAALAGQLDLRDDQKLLHDCLDEARRADAALTQLAKSEVNQDAVAA